MFVPTIGRDFDHDAPGFVEDFINKEEFIIEKVGMTVYETNVWDYRYKILTGLWSQDGNRLVQLVTPLWTENVGRYYANLGYPFQDPGKQFLKTLYWHIVREYTVHKAPLNNAGGKCQHPNCLSPTSDSLNVHHGNLSNESYVSLENGFQPIVGREHLHEGILTVSCETCHMKATQVSRIANMSRPSSFTVSSKVNPELFKQMMSNMSGNKIVNKRDVKPPSMMTIGDMIKYKQQEKDN